MSVFEITIQHKDNDAWPVDFKHQPGADELVLQGRGRLDLDPGILVSLLPSEKAYGLQLGKALFQDAIRDALVSAVRLAGKENEPLRVMLTVEAPDLRGLHWEQLHAPLDRAWDYLLLNQGTPFSLYLPSQVSRSFPLIGRGDLRALALVAGPEELDMDYGLASFDVAATAESIQKALGDIGCDLLASLEGACGEPTLSDLCERLTTGSASGSYTLLHLVCHGKHLAELGDTVLYFPGDEGQRPVTATTLIERLGRLDRLPHLVFLSTCESADPRAEAGLGGLGQRMVRELGIPAVLAMTGQVSITTAGALATAFYGRLGEHGEVDLALGQALSGLQGRYDATIPALFSRLGGRALWSDTPDRPLTKGGVSVGRDLTFYIENNYLSESAQLDKDAFRQALARYLTWLDETCGWLTLRGIKQRDQQVLTLPLDEVYTSLTVDARGSDTVDVGQLLLQGSRLVVTGAPGSGKSTVLQYTAWTLAHALRTGDPHLAVEHLGFAIPEDEEGAPQPSQLELPLPILVPLYAYAEHLRRFGDGDDARKTTLTAFVSDYLIRRQAGLGLPDDFFEQLLVRGQSCLLLLDGLDEVPDENTRVRVSRAVEDLVNAAPDNRVVVTSRPAAYGGEAVLGAHFRHLHLQPMTEEQVARLVTRLYQVAIPDEGERERETAALLRAIDNLESQRARLGAGERFITTPLLVRMIVIVHFSRRQLPEQRAELYREVVDVLLAASYHPDVNVAQALAEAGGAMSQRRDLLGVLAFHMHSQGQGTRTIREADLKRVLLDYLAPQAGAEQASQTVDAFAVAARERGSFLDERSGQYQFLHQTFQEFLAARHLAETVRDVNRMAAFLEDGRLDDAWWREPALLLVGYLSNSSPEVAGRLARRLARLSPLGAPDPGWPVLDTAQRLAGAALAAAGILEQPNAPPALRAELADLLTSLLTAGAGPEEWTETGDALARLGDPRPGVGLRPDGLPDIAWCEVPAGAFLMGSDKRRDKSALNWELPQHEVDLPAYSIAKYPLTNAQYGAFVQDGGYSESRYWTGAGWRWKGDRTGPEARGGVFDLPNHPVVMVSWYEAVAFCRWLTDRLREAGALGADQEVRLPTEAEWEKAARGMDGRIYPWGNDFAADKCNMGDTGINTTSAVGCFPDGASPYGVEDLSGNVWEWCGTEWRSSYKKAADELLEGDAPRVLRGGAFNDDRGNVRCASRDWSDPNLRFRINGFRVVVAPVPSEL